MRDVTHEFDLRLILLNGLMSGVFGLSFQLFGSIIDLVFEQKNTRFFVVRWRL